MTTPDRIIGTRLLQLFFYWWFVSTTGEWAVGVIAFLGAFALNLLHILVSNYKDGNRDAEG